MALLLARSGGAASVITPIRLATRSILFCATAISLISVVGCQASAGDPGLRVGGDPEPAIVSAGNVVGAEPVSFGSIILCLGAPGSATIREVSLIGSTGSIHLDKFAVRPNPYVRQLQSVGAERSDLAALGFSASTAQVVDTQCPKPGAEATWQGGSELAFQVSYGREGHRRKPIAECHVRVRPWDDQSLLHLVWGQVVSDPMRRPHSVAHLRHLGVTSRPAEHLGRCAGAPHRARSGQNSWPRGSGIQID